MLSRRVIASEIDVYFRNLLRNLYVYTYGSLVDSQNGLVSFVRFHGFEALFVYVDNAIAGLQSTVLASGSIRKHVQDKYSILQR